MSRLLFRTAVFAMLFCVTVPIALGDDFEHPFGPDSIWNTRIGKNARYKPAGISKGFDTEYTGTDVEYFVWTRSTDPVKRLYYPSTDQLAFPINSFHLPEWFWTEEWNDVDTPNNCTVIVNPDHRTYFEVQPMRQRPDGDWSGYPTGNDPKNYDFKTGSGRKGAHYGSGLSVMGGSLRRVNLDDGRIKHVLKVNLWGKRYLYRGVPAGNKKGPGYRWPASNADGTFDVPGSANYYNGSDRQLAMGSLLAIPPGAKFSVRSLGLKTELGRKLHWTFVHYGAYVVDNTAWKANSLCVENGVNRIVQERYGMSLTGPANSTSEIVQDIRKLFKALHVVKNNFSYNVGGGGEPLP